MLPPEFATLVVSRRPKQAYCPPTQGCLYWLALTHAGIRVPTSIPCLLAAPAAPATPPPLAAPAAAAAAPVQVGSSAAAAAASHACRRQAWLRRLPQQQTPQQRRAAAAAALLLLPPPLLAQISTVGKGRWHRLATSSSSGGSWRLPRGCRACGCSWGRSSCRLACCLWMCRRVLSWHLEVCGWELGATAVHVPLLYWLFDTCATAVLAGAWARQGVWLK